MHLAEHDSSSPDGSSAPTVSSPQIVGPNASGRARRGRRNRALRRNTGGAGRAAAGWAVLLVVAAVLAWPTIFGFVAQAASPSPSASVGADASGGATGAQSNGADVAAGAALFQQSCASCHGAQGQGLQNPDGSRRGPDIRNMGAAAADFVLRTGRMPLADPNQPMQRSKPAFNAEQIRQLVAYVASLGNGPAIPPVDVSGADLSRGKALFTANCAACHAPTGAGDAVGGGFTAPGLGKATPLDVAEAMRIGPPPMPVFGPDTFNQQDVNDIAAYVQYLQSAPSPGGLAIGEIGPVPEGFIAIFAGLTAVLLITRFVGRRGRTAQQTGLDEAADVGSDPEAGARTDAAGTAE